LAQGFFNQREKLKPPFWKQLILTVMLFVLFTSYRDHAESALLHIKEKNLKEISFFRGKRTNGNE
jgi:hypothetical protein